MTAYIKLAPLVYRFRRFVAQGPIRCWALHTFGTKLTFSLHDVGQFLTHA